MHKDELEKILVKIGFAKNNGRYERNIFGHLEWAEFRKTEMSWVFDTYSNKH